MASPNSKKSRLLAALAVLLALGAGGHRLWAMGRPGADAAGAFAGNVDVRDVTLAFRVGGRVKGVEKQEGQRVEPGEVLARLDDAPLRVALAQAKAAADVARAQLDRVAAGARREDLAEASALLSQRRSALARAEDALGRTQTLHAQAAATQAALVEAQTGAEQARAAAKAAEAALTRLVRGTRSEDVAVAQAQVAQAEAAVAAAELALADTALRAETRGVVVTRAIEPGAIVAAGAPAMVVAFEAPVYIRAYAEEPHLARLAPGTPVEVFTDARPGRPYLGHVGYVAAQAEFTPKSVETAELRTSLVYRFRVVVDEDDGGLRQGMPVTVRLVDARPVVSAGEG